MLGQTISHYRVLRRVGGGGMGDVYEAEDLNLGRHVALKFIAKTRTPSPQAVHRFEREARAASALNHPNICTIHDIGEHAGERFIVMELLDGTSLRDRLRAGALPVDETLDYAEQAADALEAAHAAGIVHRDVTPGNIFITASRQVKLVDFGLAKLDMGVEGARRIAAEMPTQSAHDDLLTAPGAVAGTVGYMSPEQVRGEPVDHRTDLFSFGVVLYEMLTGRRPFDAKTSVLVFDAILHAAPAPLPPNRVPPAIAAIIDKALEKDPRLRYQSAGEIKLDFARLRAHAGGGNVARRPRHLSRWIAVALASAAIASSMAVAAFLVRRDANDRPPAALPRQLTTGPGVETEPAISPDGSTIAFTSDEAGNQDIWLVDARGGPPQRLTTNPANDSHASWLPDGSALVFASDRGGATGIWRAPRLDGEAATLLVASGSSPAVSPDGQRMAFVRLVHNQYTRIAVASLSDPSRVRVLTGDRDGMWEHMDPAWSPDGRLIAYAAWDGLWVVPADGGASTHLTTERQDSHPAWSMDGRFVYFTSYQDAGATLWRVPAGGGAPARVTLGSGVERQPAISRDGHLLAFSTQSDDRDLVRVDTQTGQALQFGTSSREDFPVFSPDARRIYFVSNRWGSTDIWSQPISESGTPGTPRRVFEQDGMKMQPDCSRDGRWLAYYRVVGNRRDTWIAPTGGGAPVRITDDPTGAVHASWCPDGSRLAFISERSGSQQIWVQRIASGRPVGNPVRLTSEQRLYRFPVWSPEGSKIAFITNDRAGTTEVALMRAEPGSPIAVITSGADAMRVRWRTPDALLVSGRWGENTYEIRSIGRDGKRVEGPHLPLGPDPVAALFDVSRDGRFIITARGKSIGDVWVMESQAKPF